MPHISVTFFNHDINVKALLKLSLTEVLCSFTVQYFSATQKIEENLFHYNYQLPLGKIQLHMLSHKWVIC